MDLKDTRPAEYGPLLQQYGLQPDFIEHYGKVKKVYTKHGVFALKRVDDTSPQGIQFIQKLDHLNKKGFLKFVPPYQTTEGSYVVPYQNALYYLMPWLPNEPKEERDIRYHRLFQELAHLHSVSVREVELKEEQVEKHYEALSSSWDNCRAELDQYVEECEQKVYMSPFELQFCTNYFETKRAIDFARKKLDEWYEKMKEKEKEKIRLVMTHGKLSAKHFIYDENGNGYFINLERAKDASPIYDIVSFYFRTLRTHPMMSFDSYEWFSTYDQHFPLKEEEKLLLHSYLAFPEPFYQAVINYKRHYEDKSELDHSRSLLTSYWLMKNIEQVNIKILEVDQQKKAAAEAAAQAEKSQT